MPATAPIFAPAVASWATQQPIELIQGTLTEGEGSVRLTSSRLSYLKKVNNVCIIKSSRSKIASKRRLIVLSLALQFRIDWVLLSILLHPRSQGKCRYVDTLWRSKLDSSSCFFKLIRDGLQSPPVKKIVLKI